MGELKLRHQKEGQVPVVGGHRGLGVKVDRRLMGDSSWGGNRGQTCNKSKSHFKSSMEIYTLYLTFKEREKKSALYVK